MQLIGPLASGLRGAEAGTFRAFVRGTAQDAQVFTDVDGFHQDTAVAHALGAYGDGTYYVNQDVEIVAYSSGGSVVRRFVVNGSSNNVEYIGPSFTGIDPITAAPGVNNPAPVKTVLDLIRSKFGATDFDLQKDVASAPAVWSPRSLSISVGTAFFNVKDPTYGAVGNGTTNDRAAIQAAIDAASAAGGGMVLLPSGTYAINGALTLAPNVNIVGFGWPTLLVTAGGVGAIEGSAATSATLSGFYIRLSDSVGAHSAATAVAFSDSDDVLIQRIQVLGSVANGYRFVRALSVSNGNRATVDSCRFLATATSNYVVSFSNSGGFNSGNRISNTSMVGSGAGATAFYAELQDVVLSGCGPIQAVTFAVRAVDSYLQLIGCSGLVGGVFANAHSSIREAACYLAAGFVSMMLEDGFGRINDSFTTTAFANGGALASATNVVLPNGSLHKYFTINGTTTITRISSDGAFLLNFPQGYVVTLQFNDVLTLVHGSGNIRLNGAANFTTAPGSTITLQLIGSLWKEIGRTAL